MLGVTTQWLEHSLSILVIQLGIRVGVEKLTLAPRSTETQIGSSEKILGEGNGCCDIDFITHQE